MSDSSNEIIKIEIFNKKTNLSELKTFKAHLTVLENLKALKIEINHTCGGMGTCGTCKVFVDPEYQNNMSEQEQEFFEERKQQTNERLSCQIHPNPTLKKITIL